MQPTITNLFTDYLTGKALVPDRDASGRFQKGNSLRFRKGNAFRFQSVPVCLNDRQYRVVLIPAKVQKGQGK